MTSNASKTSTASTNQKRFESYKTLASEGKSLKVGKIFYKDGKQYQLHIFAKDTSGEWIKPGDRLNEKAPEIVQKVDELSKVLTKATDEKHSDKVAQDKFYKSTDVQHVKNDKLEDSQSELSKIPIPKSAQKEFERLAFGGITDGISAHQKEILEFETPGRDLSTISDKAFVKAYKESKKELTKPGHTPAHIEIYAAAMTKYVTQSVSDFLSGVPAAEKPSLTKKLSSTAQTLHESVTGETYSGSEWIKGKADAEKLGDTHVHTAIFKALNTIRSENYTAQHVFDQMKSKVCDAWDKVVEPKIDSDTVVATILPTGEGSSPEVILALKDKTTPLPLIHEPPVKSLGAYKDVIDQDRSKLQSDLSSKSAELSKAREQLATVKSKIRYGINPFSYTSHQYELTNQKDQLEQTTIPRLEKEETDLKEQITSLDRVDITQPTKTIEKLTAKIKEIESREESILSSLFSTDIGLAESLERNRQLIDVEKRFSETTWDPTTTDLPKKKIEALYLRLQLFNQESGRGITADYAGAAAKLKDTKLDVDFTHEELKAISEWKASGSLTTHTELLDSLVKFLEEKPPLSSSLSSELRTTPYHTKYIQMVKVQQIMGGITSEKYKSAPPKPEHYKQALQTLTGTPYYFSFLPELIVGKYHSTEETDYAIHAINKTISPLITGAERYQVLCEKLAQKVESYEIDGITPSKLRVPGNVSIAMDGVEHNVLTGFTEDQAYNNWKVADTLEDFKEALQLFTSSNPSFTSLTTGVRNAIYFASKHPTDISSQVSNTHKYHKITKNINELMLTKENDSMAKEIAKAPDKVSIPAKDFRGAYLWAIGKKESLSSAEQSALKFVGGFKALDTATKTRQELVTRLHSHLAVAAAQEQIQGIETDKDPFSTWVKNPPIKDFEAALDYLKSPTDLRQPAGVKYALAYVMPPAESAEKFTTMQNKLRLCIRAMTNLDAGDVSGYTPNKKDLSEAAAWLDGHLDALTEGAKKALVKAKGSEDFSTLAPYQRLDFYKKALGTTFQTLPITLTSDDPQTFWNHIGTITTTMTVDLNGQYSKVWNDSAFHKELIDKLKTNAKVDKYGPLELYALKLYHDKFDSSLDTAIVKVASLELLLGSRSQ